MNSAAKPAATTSAKRSPTRPWFQFGLRTFFLVLTLVSVVFGGSISFERNRCRQGQAAVKALEQRKMGALAKAGYFYATWRLPPQPTIESDANWEPRPDWLREILGDNSFERVDLVSLTDEDATDANLVHVGRLTGIKELRVVGGAFTDKGLAQLRGLRKLESLFINQKAVSDRGIGQLANLPLKRLEVHATQVTGSGLEGFSHLEELGIGNTPLTDTDLAALRRIRGLRKIDLSFTDVTGVGLAGFTGLEELEIRYTPLTDNGVAAICRNEALRTLTITDTQISDASLKHLAGLPRLERLTLYSDDITDAGMEHLGHLSRLEYVMLTSSHITDEGLAHLTNLQNLGNVRLKNSRVTQDGVAKLKRSLPSVMVWK